MKVFHHNDNDGRLSGFLVKQQHPEAEAIEVNYGKPFPLERIEKEEEIWIVDYNPLPSEMLKVLERTKNVTWIDHHKTGIELFKDFPHEIAGIRDTSKAACVLVCEYLYNKEIKSIPATRFVELVGDRDTWTFKFGDDSKYFHLGSMLYDTSPRLEVENGEIGLWLGLCNGSLREEDIIKRGRIVEDYRDRQNSDLRKAWAFEVQFEGLKCLAMVTGLKGSEVFGEQIKDYPICIAMAFNGKKWVNSLYSTSMDISGIAKGRGGGGHPGASGFQTKEFLFADGRENRIEDSYTFECDGCGVRFGRTINELVKNDDWVNELKCPNCKSIKWRIVLKAKSPYVSQLAKRIGEQGQKYIDKLRAAGKQNKK